jgi:transcriptional regulator with XRE-family HTH domain
MRENESTNRIHERLRSAREQAGLSQGQVAKLLNYHRPTISEIEAGRRKVTSEEVAAFAELYDISVAWLLNESEEHNPVVELAARELSKLRPQDLDRILRLLKSLKKEKD